MGEVDFLLYFCSVKKIWLTLFLYELASTQTVLAQHHGVLVDMETRWPVAGASIYTNTGNTYVSDKNGHYYIIDDKATSVTVTHTSYLRRNLNLKNLKDSTFLLPKSYTLNTVVITGEAPKVHFDTSSSAMLKGCDGIKGPSGINLLGIFERKCKVGRKLREKSHKVVAKY